MMRVHVDTVLGVAQMFGDVSKQVVQTVEPLPGIVLSYAEDGSVVSVEVIVPGHFARYPDLFGATLTDGG